MTIRSFFAALLLCSASPAFSQTADEVKTDVMSALATPLPITVVGPIITPNVVVTQDGQSFNAVLENATLMGMVPMGTVSFKLTPAGPKLYRISDFTLPKSIDFLNMATVGIGATKFDGLWSAETRSYQTLGFELGNLTIAPKSAGGGKIGIGTFALEVAKEGVAGAVESQFVINAKGFSSQGVLPVNMTVANFQANLKADGEEPVDLYGVLQRFAMLAIMQSDGNAALQFAEALRAKSYSKVNLTLRSNGVEVRDTQPGSTRAMRMKDVAGMAEVTAMTPDSWGALTVNFTGKDIHDTGFLDIKALDIGEGSFGIAGERIPIGATLNTINQLNASGKGEQVVINVSELLDGILGLGKFVVSSGGKGIVFKPLDEKEPVVTIASYVTDFGLQGFADKKGQVLVRAEGSGIDLGQRTFSDALSQKTYDLFSPQSFKYDLSIGDLNETLLQKLAKGLVFRNEQDAMALAVPAVVYAMASKPMIETKAFDYKSAQFSVESSSSLRFYPAWLLEALSVEGSSKVKVTGLEKVTALFEEYVMNQTPAEPAAAEAVQAPMATEEDKAAMDAVEEAKKAAEAAAAEAGGAVPLPVVSSSNRESLIMLQSIASTFRALGTEEGDSVTWDVQYPKAGVGLMVVNGTELRFPGFTSYLGPAMMFGLRGL
jgi:hypothetical protein